MHSLFRIKHCPAFFKQSILLTKTLVPVRSASLPPYRNPYSLSFQSASLDHRARRMLTCRSKEDGRAGTGTGSGSGSGEPYRDPSSNRKVSQLREVMNRSESDGWEKSWEEGIVPWDLGKATPVLVRLVQSDSLPNGRALVPGCGTGYDVVALASSERYVVGLDISFTAVRKAQQWSTSFANKDQFTFLAEDFFNWNPTELFDLIFDYTFFCAIEPVMRPAWAKKINQFLKPDGELITLIYLITDQKEGPPFNNTLYDYEKVLNHLGFKAIYIEDNELAVKPRKGREKLVIWKRIVNPSSL